MNLNLVLQRLIDLKVAAKQCSTSESHISGRLHADGKEYAILGNPNLGEVRVFFLGVENRKRHEACTEVWFNELRLGGLDEKGGWAALGRVDMKLADLGTLICFGKCKKRRASVPLNNG